MSEDTLRLISVLGDVLGDAGLFYRLFQKAEV